MLKYQNRILLLLTELADFKMKKPDQSQSSLCQISTNVKRFTTEENFDTGLGISEDLTAKNMQYLKKLQEHEKPQNSM